MLKPKQTPYNFTIAIPNPYQNRSPQKVTPNLTPPRIKNNSHIYHNTHSLKQTHFLIQLNDQTKKPSFRKPLTLDNSLFQNEIYDQKVTQTPPFNQGKEKSVTKIPTNPFEQILNQSDTPDFNMSLPFVEDFSKIDMKSPTFSDIFTMSEIKSPQFKNQITNFFMTARKKPNQSKEDLSKTVKLRQEFRKDVNEDKFMQKMDRYIREMNIQKLQIRKQPQTVRNKSQNVNNQKKPTIGYKLKNHFNPSTPKLSKQPDEIVSLNNILQKGQKACNYQSIQSNPEEQGKMTNPIATTYPKSPKVYKFSNQSISQSKEINISSNRQPVRHSKRVVKDISYKMAFPRREMREEMEEIYNGKFKIQKSVRN